MSLQNAKTAIATSQIILGLNPSTVPEIEFLVESYFFQAHFRDKLIRVSCACSDAHSDELKGKSYSVINVYTTDKAEEEYLQLFYYDGESVPSGPRHALIIDQHSAKGCRNLYWREYNQDPKSEWKFNRFSLGREDFVFTIDGTPPKPNSQEFISQEAFYTFICDFKIEQTIGLDATTEFTVELAYLQLWNNYYDGHLYEKGVTVTGELAAIDKKASEYIYEADACLHVTCENDNNVSELSFFYYKNEASPKDYGLVIIDDGNCVHRHKPGQYPAWEINCMADDPEIVDQYGYILFPGEAICI